MKDLPGQLQLRFAELRVHDAGFRLAVYTGREFSGGPVTVVLLSAAAASDAALRQAFATAVNTRGSAVGEGLDAASVHASDVHSDRPWAAIRGHPGEPAVDWLLFELTGALAPAPAVPPVPPALPDEGDRGSGEPPPRASLRSEAPVGGSVPWLRPAPFRPADAHRDRTTAVLVSVVVIGALLVVACCGLANMASGPGGF